MYFYSYNNSGATSHNNDAITEQNKRNLIAFSIFCLPKTKKPSKITHSKIKIKMKIKKRNLGKAHKSPKL